LLEIKITKAERQQGRRGRFVIVPFCHSAILPCCLVFYRFAGSPVFYIAQRHPDRRTVVSRKTVYIAACGIGLGHIGRMVAVADELVKLGAEPVFSTYGPAFPYITSAGYKAYDSPVLMWEENYDGSVSTRRSVSRLGDYVRVFRTHLAQERERIARLRPAAIVSDSRYSTLFVKDMSDAPLFFVSNQIRFLMPHWREGGFPRLASDLISRANYHWLRDVCGIFVPDFPLPDSISRENMDVPADVMSRLRFTGPISRKAPQDLPDAEQIRRRLGFGDDLFVYAAVSGPGRSRAPIIEALKKVLPDFRRKSLIVRGEPGNASSEWLGDLVNIRGWADDRFELLKACDVVVSRPGLTTISEIVSFGKPCVLIPTPGQSEQEGNARNMQKLGAARLLEQSRVDHRTLKDALEHIVSRSADYARSTSRLKDMAATMGGARSIAQGIMDKIG
jgi:UDP-N-acetylglucosamine--N-acetylmuramyl-(pentapeptide) pyrophosphoryl-undecaprenol N-acetylglucosamine transferase